jgi:RNA polymerase sigma factor (sigma-70 family)
MSYRHVLIRIQEPMAHGPHESAAGESDAESLAHLFREHNRLLVAYLMSRLRSVHEAKDVAQEAFVRLLELKHPPAPSLLRAYLFKTATHLAIDRLRHRAVRQSAEQSELSEQARSIASIATDPADALAAHQRAEQLIGFLQELPIKCRQVFDLHRLQGLAQQEVGARLGLSERMVRRYVTYALVYCRLRLDGMPARQVGKEVKL